MRWILRILGGLVVLVVVLGAVGMVLPRIVTVERSVAIDAPPETVFPRINSLQAAAEWSPWLELDPDVQTTYSGPESGVGNRLEWASEHPQVGNGTQEIVESAAPERVVSALDFGDMGGGTATFVLAAEGAGTLVTWGLDADLGAGPVGRWMGLMMDNWVGADFETGLAQLKTLVEAES
ncbi:MAG: SRPBCC family protein [Pseudomonadota bacterium]